MNKFLITFFILHSSFFALHFNAQTPAFPGAEGHARYTTTGGRGGNVYHVTTLADDASGNTKGSSHDCV